MTKDDTYDPEDPQARLRKRLTDQYDQTDPSTPSTDASASAGAPIPAADFGADQRQRSADLQTYMNVSQPNAAPDNPQSPGRAVDTYTPPKPAYNLTPSWQDAAHPPQPQDPYYAEWAAANPGNAAAAAPAIGNQIELVNGQNVPYGGAAGASSANYNSRPTDLATAIQMANQGAYGGRNKHDNPAYWADMWAKDPGYTWDRLWGKGGGKGTPDAALAGPWTGGDPDAEKFGGAPAASGTVPGAPAGLASYYQNPNQSVAQSFVAGLQAPGGMWNSDFTSQLRQILMQRLQQANQPVDPNNPNITQAMTAARDTATRSTDQERTALAEDLYAHGGLNTDAIPQRIQQSGERNATALGSLHATLVQREITQKQSELKDLMQMALASGDAESARAIQMQLAALAAMLQEEGMGVNLAEFGAQLNQNAALAGLRG